jgi:large subunit ribosomal protein L24e
MPKCSFCGKEYSIHKGLTYVKTDGNVFYFCSSKCRKNYNLKRDKKKVKWVKKMHISKKQEIEEIKKAAEEKKENKKEKQEIKEEKKEESETKVEQASEKGEKPAEEKK